MSDEAPRTEPGSDLPSVSVQDAAAVAEQADAQQTDAQQTDVGRASTGGETVTGTDQEDSGSDPLVAALALADARLSDLQRERADFVNYRRRVERDREVSGSEGRVAVLSTLLPVLDDIDGARTHGDLSGPFAAVADKLDAVLARLGLEPFGAAGELFDPALHEALLQDADAEVDAPTCTRVLQRGYRVGERVLRPARVAVASP